MEEIIKRGGKERKITIGVTPDGKSLLSNESVEPEADTGQKTKRFPTQLVITFDEGEGNGGVSKIETYWKEVMLSNTGKPIHATGQMQKMTTIQEDVVTFVVGLGMPILRAMLNGDIRANLGFNHMPVFNAQGQLIEYTEAQENEPPTNDYYSTPTPPTE